MVKTISLLLIGCVFLSGCAVTSQTQNGQVLGSGQTSAQQLAGSVSAAAEVVTPRMLFESAIRLNSVNERGSSYYVLFSPDGKLAYLYSNNGKTVETLQRRTLPTGTSVWNVEDDDTKNLKQTEGLWTIERRMKLLAVQPKVDVDQSLGGWIEERFEGVLPAASCPGIRYSLTVRHREHSGDGAYHLAMTYLEAENGKDVTFESVGRRLTQRGTPDDANATVWQLIDDNGKIQANFRFDSKEQTLTMLRADGMRIPSSLNYTLKRVDTTKK